MTDDVTGTFTVGDDALERFLACFLCRVAFLQFLLQEFGVSRMLAKGWFNLTAFDL